MAKLLLMEDDALQRALLADLLEANGHDVVACANATEALEKARSERFDIVLTDIIVRVEGRSQPDGGISLIGQIRRFSPGGGTRRDVPIIAISGTYKNPGMSNILTTAKQVGATEELKKPIDEAALNALINQLLRN